MRSASVPLQIHGAEAQPRKIKRGGRVGAERGGTKKYRFIKRRNGVRGAAFEAVFLQSEFAARG